MLGPKLLVKLCLFALQVHADFYISPTGSDNGAGTKDQPFQSFEKAQSAVRAVNKGMTTDLNVFVSSSTYYLNKTLSFTAADSGFNGHRVIWQAEDIQRGTNISGGIPITQWTKYDNSKNIYVAQVPQGTKSRHLFVNQKHAQIARTKITRSWLQVNSQGYSIVNSGADFITSLAGLGGAEIRAINSFTDRISPIDKAQNKQLIMKQPAFANNVIGYDTIVKPDVDHGFYIENALGLLDEDNEWFLDTSGKLYYKPPSGSDITKLNVVLGKLEQLLIVSGTYDNPAQNVVFKGFNYMHTTWNKPSTNVGYVDQQTGAYIGENTTYPEFEASRPKWYQIPGSVQASAARNILFQNGSMTSLMGGFGIGNDANAHSSGVGLGASVEISGMYFSDTGANAITVGGVQADSHHPSNSNMINKDNRILENIFVNNAITITSAVAILVTYTQNTQVVHNDISQSPYSGMCFGYGWGSNDAGGSPEYQNRGLYKYQPKYTTPTIMTGGYIAKNLVNKFGQLHSDLGGIYTLSKSPNTSITENWVLDGAAAIYHDEGSRDYATDYSVFNTGGYWLLRNERSGYTTGNLTLHDIASNSAPSDSTNQFGDRISSTSQYSSYGQLSQRLKQVVVQAGIPVDQRSRRGGSIVSRPVS